MPMAHTWIKGNPEGGTEVNIQMMLSIISLDNSPHSVTGSEMCCGQEAMDYEGIAGNIMMWTKMSSVKPLCKFPS